MPAFFIVPKGGKNIAPARQKVDSGAADTRIGSENELDCDLMSWEKKLRRGWAEKVLADVW